MTLKVSAMDKAKEISFFFQLMQEICALNSQCKADLPYTALHLQVPD